MTGEAVTIWTVRIALLLYVAALFSWLHGRGHRIRGSRLLWTAGWLCYLAHVAAAFHYVHRWSHHRALAETAAQTEALVGMATGFGLWLNYLFTAVWTADVVWWWLDEDGYRLRPQLAAIAVHAFLGFMFFNGAVVFATGLSRWVGLAAAALLVPLWFRGRRRSAIPVG
jgi:hypothetical protein